MYNNDMYPGEGTDTNTSGAYTEQNRNEQNQNEQYRMYHFEDTEKNKKEKHSSGFFRKAAACVLLGLFFGLFAGVGFYGVQYMTGSIEEEQPEAPALSGQINNNVEDLVSDEESKSGIKLTDTEEIKVVSSDVTEVVEVVMPAMVSIVNNYTEISTSFFGQSYSQSRTSSGSGIIVGESETELLIVSNHHVVSEAEVLEVTFIDGTTAEAQIKGMDSGMDLAVIAIPLESLSEETKEAIAISTLGDSESLKLGEPVIAIGNALGYGQSVTNGIVSALDREITMEEGYTGTFIQTNAAINPGNSGGALLNVNGEVIGINSSKIGGTTIEGMGYAIPISAAKPIIEELMLKETRTKVEEDKIGYMGISMPQTVTNEYYQMYNMPIGVYVRDVEEGSPAEKAGLYGGDIIVKFEGEKISTYQDLQNMIQYYEAGDTVTLIVMRRERGNYVEKEISVVLGERPKSE